MLHASSLLTLSLIFNYQSLSLFAQPKVPAYHKEVNIAILIEGHFCEKSAYNSYYNQASLNQIRYFFFLIEILRQKCEAICFILEGCIFIFSMEKKQAHYKRQCQKTNDQLSQFAIHLLKSLSMEYLTSHMMEHPWLSIVHFRDQCIECFLNPYQEISMTHLNSGTQLSHLTCKVSHGKASNNIFSIKIFY